MRKKQMDFCKKMICILLLGMFCFLAACSNQNGKKESGFGKGSFGNKDNLPEDTPWNHGISAIMETEQGWYTTGLGEDIGLRYYEKGTKNTILLCNKPECEHQGDDTCEATYRHLKVVNACLYEGYIYLLGWEGVYDSSDKNVASGEILDTVTYSLYRAALDGSAIDKVATVVETDNSQHQEVNPFRRVTGDYEFGDNNEDGSFIIHKGVAYIPVRLQLGEGSIGLRAAGLYKVDLSTGAIKEIETYDSLQSSIPALLCGVGDYVYYYRYDSGKRKSLWYRYVISEDRIEDVDPAFSEESSKNEAFEKHFVVVSQAPAFTVEREYFLVRSLKEREAGVLAILAVDANTKEILPGESFETQIAFNKNEYRQNRRWNGYYSLTLYDGKFLIADLEKAYVYDLQGNHLAEIDVKERLKISDQGNMRLDFKICNGRLYLIYGNDFNSFGLNGLWYYHRVLSCSWEELLNGQGEWSLVYRLQGTLPWEEYIQEAKDKYEQTLKELLQIKEQGDMPPDWAKRIERQQEELDQFLLDME